MVVGLGFRLWSFGMGKDVGVWVGRRAMAGLMGEGRGGFGRDWRDG